MAGDAPLLTMRLSRAKAATRNAPSGVGTDNQMMRASAQREMALVQVGLPMAELDRRGAREII
jgi:hypothetical protein